MLSLMKPLPFDTQRVTKAAAGLGSEQTRPRPRQSRLRRQTLRLGPRCAPQSGGAPRPAAKQWPRATVPPQAVALECFRGPATRRAPRCRPAAHPIRHRTPHAAPVARAKGTAGIAPPLPRRMSCCLLQASTWQRLAPALLLGPPSSGKGWGGGGGSLTTARHCHHPDHKPSAIIQGSASTRARRLWSACSSPTRSSRRPRRSALAAAAGGAPSLGLLLDPAKAGAPGRVGGRAGGGRMRWGDFW